MLLVAIAVVACAAPGTPGPSGTASALALPSLRTMDPTPSAGSLVPATVVRIVDGDTIHVAIAGREFTVRYIGMDTPETVAPGRPVELYGKEAAEANRALVDGRRVLLEKDVSETDRFGRLLRYVYIETPEGLVMVNAELVRLGYAQVATFPPDVKYVDLFLALQREARAERRGLWADATPTPTASPATRSVAR